VVTLSQLRLGVVRGATIGVSVGDGVSRRIRAGGRTPRYDHESISGGGSDRIDQGLGPGRDVRVVSGLGEFAGVCAGFDYGDAGGVVHAGRGRAV
jgi:hypothetical protein